VALAARDLSGPTLERLRNDVKLSFFPDLPIYVDKGDREFWRDLMNRILCGIFMLLGITAALATAGNKPQRGAAAYALQVVPFQVQEGVDLPGEYVDAITNDLVSQLSKSGLFEQVLRSDEKASGGAPLLQLTGTVVGFRKGNRAVRVIGGLAAGLAGRTQINAHIKFIDTATQQVKMERDVAGVWTGGGKSVTATLVLAKQVAKAAKKEL
jgi:hypothetical protein